MIGLDADTLPFRMTTYIFVGNDLISIGLPDPDRRCLPRSQARDPEATKLAAVLQDHEERLEGVVA